MSALLIGMAVVHDMSVGTPNSTPYHPAQGSPQAMIDLKQREEHEGASEMLTYSEYSRYGGLINGIRNRCEVGSPSFSSRRFVSPLRHG